jgi:hypothetical protein
MLEPHPPVSPPLSCSAPINEDMETNTFPAADTDSDHCPQTVDLPIEPTEPVKLDQSALSLVLPLPAAPPIPVEQVQSTISLPLQATPSPPDLTPYSSRDCVSADATGTLVETPIPPGRNTTPLLSEGSVHTPLHSSRAGTPSFSTPLHSSRAGTPSFSERDVTSETTGLQYVGMETPFHKKVSFQDLHHQQERPSSRLRPLPPIGSVKCDDDHLPPKARRLPPLSQTDAFSLYSASSHSQLFSRPGSTHSLPLPDPRYSTAPRSCLVGETGGPHLTTSHRNSSNVERKELGEK